MNAEQLAEFDQKWALLDVNGDGFVEKAENKEFLTKLMAYTIDAGVYTQADIDEMIEKFWKEMLEMDTNQDGKVSK